jgi:hypothetical protein
MANIIPPKHAQTAKNQEELQTENIESYKLVQTSEELEQRVTPRLDYSDPEKFVTYGSAEQYYVSAIENIYNEYPYDGSKNEKNQWHLTASGLDNYVFENEYPRTNGHITISSAGFGGEDASEEAGKYVLPTNKEYITIYGGPSTDTTAKNLASLFPSAGGKANIIDATENRESNLTLGGTAGNTIEFWLKKGAFVATDQQEVVFDMWASGSTQGTSDYGRMCVYMQNKATEPCLGLAYISGTVGIQDTFALTSQASIADGSWHHYAIAVSAVSGTADLYIDGEWTEAISGTPIGEVTGAFVANIGAYYEARPADGLSLASGTEEGWWGSTSTSVSPLTSPDGVPLAWELDPLDSDSLMPQAAAVGNVIWDIDGSGDLMPDGDIDVSPFSVMVPGWCKMSGSIDEFRFWKTERNATQIGLNWRTQVFGGTNTDEANTDLGVYYKFNEGITSEGFLDSSVLDYSGRISNGTWTGYLASGRSTTSAMVESGASTAEFKDPIIYEQDPLVSALKTSKKSTGLLYDQQNNASLYNSMPMWIREEDSGSENLLKLTQVMSSYLDTLQNSVSEVNAMKNLSYPSGSEEPHSFIKRNIQNLGFDTADFFLDATVLEKFMDRNLNGDLEYKLNDIKNLIYQNIYNNLTFIMSSKGTEKSFRNLSRCFGISDDLLRLKIYSDNQEYKLEDKYETVSEKKNTIDFNDPTRFESTICQNTSSLTPSRNWISSSGDFNLLHGATLEGDFVFLEKPNAASPFYFDTPFTKSSVFGMHGASSSDLTWLGTDYADLQIYANREQTNGANAYFQLTSSALGIDLTSSIFSDVYGGERWNLAAKIKNNDIDTAGSYVLEFQGVNAAGDRIDDSFVVTASLDQTKAINFLEQGKRVYAGAYKTNFTGSTIHKSDILASGVRYWAKHLSDDAITNHAKTLGSYGIKDPNRPVFNAANDMPAIDTLKLSWNFETTTAADASGEFDIADVSSGSADKVALYGTSFGYMHAGKGYGFPASATAVNKEYIPTLKRINPENSNGSDMVKVLTQAEEIQQELSNPTSLAFGIEKSLYQIISDEMLKFFSTSADLASLYFKPSDKYNTANQELSLIRQEFFNKMENTPDVNKFYDYFKWVDDAVVTMLRQQLPASAEVLEGPVNVIESHILERNKYLHKTPTYATTKSRIIEGSMRTPNAEKTK